MDWNWSMATGNVNKLPVFIFQFRKSLYIYLGGGGFLSSELKINQIIKFQLETCVL